MTHNAIQLPVLYAERGLSNCGQQPVLCTYILDSCAFNADRARPIVIICPGGGYSHLSEREAESVAIQMNALGMHAAVLRYSLAPMDFPCAMLDAATAMAYVRAHAQEWHVNPDALVLCGFSAGGHVAASLGCRWNSPLIQQYLPYSAMQIKPDALLLCYPVITAQKPFCHEGSVRGGLGRNCAGKFELFSLENLVNADVPPVFMWHTNEDAAVPAENSLLFAAALRRQSVPLEYHLFSTGRHGLALSTAESSDSAGTYVNAQCAVWPQLFAQWWRALSSSQRPSPCQA